MAQQGVQVPSLLHPQYNGAGQIGCQTQDETLTETEFSKITAELQRRYRVLWIIATHPVCTVDDLVEKTQLPRHTLWRLIRKLRTDLAMDIEFVRGVGSVGKTGYYRVADWGIIDRKRFMAVFHEYFESEQGRS